MDGWSELHDAERDLQAAIQSADLEALERLLDDRLVHVGPDGSPQDKRALISARATGAMDISRMEQEAVEVIVDGATGVTRATVAITASVGGSIYAWRVVVTRTWLHSSRGWAVLAEHASVVESGDLRAADAPAPESPRYGRLRLV